MAFESLYISVASESTIKLSSWIYWADWILTLILSLGFVFYFHRLLGFVVSFVFKIVLWRQYRISVNIRSFKVSPLGGRLFMKNLTILTSDMTISIINLTFTWRYWIFKLNRLSNFYFEIDNETPEISQKRNDKLPSRFLLVIEGLEVFIYNRTVAYDNIMDMLQKNNDVSSSEEKTDQESSLYSDDIKNGNLRFRNKKRTSNTSSSDEGLNNDQTAKDSLSLFFLLQVLPIAVKIKRGAIVIGNVSTPSILVASYKAASGTIDVAKSPNILDPYRLLYDCVFNNFQLWMRPNIGYEKYRYGLEAHQEYSQPTRNDTQKLTYMKKYRTWFKYQRATEKLRKLYYKVFRQEEPENMGYEPNFNWRGLKRYIGDNQDDSEVFAFLNSDVQYAKYSLILDSVTTRLIYFYDNPGIQPQQTNLKTQMPPESGIEVEISNGTIHYGPWTDRERVPIQNMLFPPVARDSSPTRGFLKPGSQREYGGFKVTVIVKDEVIIRIPTREPSKDKELIKLNAANNGPTKNSRPFGWLEVKLSEGSNVSTFTSYVAKEDGWPNIMKVIFNLPEIRSSVNHDVLFMADSHEIDAKIGFPLQWNGKCTWEFDQVSLNPQIFFLREHTMLFSDLFTDFGLGDPQPYEYFRLFIYNIKWKLLNYKFYLNVNDLNIVNNPLDFEKNKYLSLQGEELDCDINLPLNGLLTKSTTVLFNITTPHFDLVLDTPPWHTVNAFWKESNVVGRSNHFSVDGLYKFFSGIEVNTSDYVEIRCMGDEVSLKFYGFVIRYLFTVRENYFGDNIHFKTFEEYTNQESQDQESRDGTSSQEPNYWKLIKTENDMDVFFTFQVRSGLVMLPYHTYSCQSHIGLNFDMLDIDIRFCNYYMDMQVDFSPISAVFVEDYYSVQDPLLSVNEYVERYFNRRADMHVDGFSVHTHRMFGVPPEELTFYCKWDFCAGDWLVDSTPMFMRAVAGGISNFGVGFMDLENALDVAFPPAFDAANFTFKCPNFTFRLRPDSSSCLEIQLVDFLLSYNDMSNNRYSNKLVVSIPTICLKVFKNDVIAAFLNTSLIFTNICQKRDMLGHRETQQLHVRNSDAPFHRSPFILLEEYRDDFYESSKGCLFTPVSLPNASIPLTELTFNMSKKLNIDIDTSSISSDSEYAFTNRMPPTNDYLDEDFTPSYKVDPDTEYDSFIVELGDVEAFVSPKCIEIIVSTLQAMEDYSADTIMDQLNVSTIKFLGSLINSIKTVKNCRVVNHDLSIKFGEFLLADTKELTQKAKKHPTITLQISDLSLALSEKASKTVNEGNITSNEEISLALHIKDILISVAQPFVFNAAVIFTIQEVEYWMELTPDDFVASGNVETISLNIDDTQTTWLVDGITKTIETIEEMNSILKKHTRKINASACLVHALTLASIEYYVDYDPDVLTKPAYILRAKKEHIRFFDSWKVIARLRHILQSLPADWLHEVNGILRDKRYILPQDSLDEVTEIFSKWRAWEANQEERLRLLNRIFSGDTANSDKRQMHLQFLFGNISLKLVSSNQTDYIVLQQFSTTLDLDTTKDRKPVDVVVGLGAYQSSITVLLLDKLKLLQLIKENKKSNDMEQKEEEVQGELKNVLQDIDLSISIYIEAFRQQILLLTLVLELQGNNMASISTIKEEMKSISNSFTLKNAVCNLWGSSNPVYSQAMENISWVVARTSAFDKDLYKVDLELDKVDIHMANKNDKILTVLQSILEADVPYVEKLLSESESKSTSTLNISDLLGYISLKLSIQEFNWRIDILSPVVLEGNSIGCTVSACMIDDNFIFDADFLKGKFNMNIDEHNVIEIENSKFVNVVEVGIWENLILFSVQSSMGYAKLLSPNLISAIGLSDITLPKLEKKIHDFKSLLANNKLVKHNETDAPEREFAFKVQFSNDYMGVSSFVNKTKLLFEVESFALGVYNVNQVESEDPIRLQQLVPIYGSISVPAVRISILDRKIPIGLSNMLDVNFGIRLLSVDSLGVLQTLQFESQYCRICLSEPIVFKLIKISDEILKALPKPTTQETQQKPKESIAETENGDLEKFIFSRISTVQFLSYNFCVGWLFNDSSKDYPGIIMGAERFFAATEFKLGKFTLMEAYFSVANGNRSSNFYSTLSEKSNLNRAFLPNLQLSFFIDNNRKGKNLSLSMHGDELDVKFLSTSVAIIEKAVNLASNVQSYLDKRLKPFYQDIERESSTSHKESLFTSSFDAIEFITTFAGSNVLIHRLDNHDDSESPASLYLHAPAIKTAIKYLNKKNQGKNKLMGEILTTSSDNTLYSKCMPVVMDIINGTKGLLGKSKKVSSNDLLVEEQPQSSDFITTILDDTDIHFGVRIENQSLSLSCEPTAKVAAIVGLEGIFIQLNSSDFRTSGFNVSMMVDSVSVSLQHIYSRDISASAGIKNILLTNTFEFSEVTRLFLSGSISDADAYINVKQYQDVDLFKDIWFPKEYFESYSGQAYPEEDQEESPIDDTFEELALAKNRNISSRFREVSTTYAFPWIVAFVISNVNVRVDFGQSLGNFNLRIENFWAVSKKSVDWSQDLKTGVNEVSLSSIGRLGGILSIKNINLHTAISWKLDLEITLDVPLILVSGGVEELHLKMSFDHHVIAIANFEEFSMDIYNKKSEVSIAKDHLFMTTTFKTAEIYITSLTASNFLDIQNTISRMIQENQRSYKETLRDSSKGKSLEEKKRRRYSQNAILETVKKLETRIHVSAGKVLMHIYPSSMDNSKVLVIKLDQSRAKFQQNEYSSGISNELDLKFNDLKVSLSSVSPVLEEFVNEASVSELTQHAHKASGGTIFVFPSFRISMRTFQKYNSNLIEYMFQSTFNGTVDIRWNLGSINFIREMYTIHSKSLESRMEYRKKMQPFDEGAGAIAKAILEHQITEEDTTQKIDDAIKETIEKVEKSSKFKYSALAPPIIEEPQLKELGNATPPLEWFGLHREKLPHVTHQLAIVSLQKLIHEIELEYSKMLGKA